MPTIGDLVSTLRVDGRPWESGMKKARGSLGGLVKNVTSGFAQIGLAANGVKTVFNALIGPMQEAQEAALAERKLAQVFKSTGNAAGIAKDEIMAFAAERQNLTSFDADDTVNAAAILGSFTNVKGDAFTQGLTSAQDLSAFLGTDLQSSIIMVGKALNDPAKGLTSLGRAGIQFSESQKKQIKTLQETGKMADAQAMILKELQTQFGGQAEALVDPLKQAQNAWGDLMEDIGTIANEKLLPWIPKMVEGFKSVSDVVSTVAQGISNAAEELQSMSFMATALASGMSLDEARTAHDEVFGLKSETTGVGGMAGAMQAGRKKQIQEAAGYTVNPKLGPQTLDEMFAKEAQDLQNMKLKKLALPAEKMLGGLIRDGIAGLQSGVMSLGPAAKEGAGRQANQIGSLEANSQEAFEVMRANVGGGKDKIQEKQLAAQQSTAKNMEKVAKVLANPKLNYMQKVQVVDID